MKCWYSYPVEIDPRSPPSRGAWIEMALIRSAYWERKSPPSRGAWIEIPLGCAGLPPPPGRPPRGGRGLKYLQSAQLIKQAGVAPLAGGED